MEDFWIESFEILVDQYMEAGMTEREAEDKAEDEAYEHACDRLADMADFYCDMYGPTQVLGGTHATIH